MWLYCMFGTTECHSKVAEKWSSFCLFGTTECSYKVARKWAAFCLFGTAERSFKSAVKWHALWLFGTRSTFNSIWCLCNLHLDFICLLLTCSICVSFSMWAVLVWLFMVVLGFCWVLLVLLFCCPSFLNWLN